VRPHCERFRLFVYSTICVMLIAIPGPARADDLSSGEEPSMPAASVTSPAPDRPVAVDGVRAEDLVRAESASLRFDGPPRSASPGEPVVTVPRHRPAALIPLYGSFAALQALDVHSTWQALNHGAVEGNPVIAPIVGTRGFPLLKVATTSAIIFAAERLRKTHPRAAVVMMIAANSAYAMIVANNYLIVRRD
jgi:hypothetical protein